MLYVYVFRVWSAERDQFKARIHWAPPYLPNEVTTDFQGKFGKVHAISFEKCNSKGFEGVRTGVRSVVMSGRKQDIPHIIPLLRNTTPTQVINSHFVNKNIICVNLYSGSERNMNIVTENCKKEICKYNL